jgi:LPXTG-motif cell wall-anchored protein
MVLLALITMLALTGAAAAVLCGRRVADAGEAGIVGGIAGSIACFISGAIFVIPWFRDLMSHDANLYSLSAAHTALSLASMIIETGIYGAIYLFFGFSIAMFGGYLYYRRRRKKERKS